MPKLDIKQYERASDGSSVTFRDETVWETAGLPKREDVVLFGVLQKLGDECQTALPGVLYLKREEDTNAPFPDVFILNPSFPETADIFRIPLKEGGVFSFHVFAMPKKADLIETSGSEFIGQIYYDAATRNVYRLTASYPITMTDAYAEGYGYDSLDNLLQLELDHEGYLVPHFTYDYEPLPSPNILFDTEYPFGGVYVMNQLPYRRAASKWWSQLNRNRQCMNDAEKKSYDFFMFDLEGACSRFEAEYYEDAANILCSLDTRTPSTLSNC